jgi:hypothetical protein
VVLVPVRDGDARDAVALESREVRVHHVDAETSPVEPDPAVDDEHFASLLEGEAVHPDLAKAAEGDEA